MVVVVCFGICVVLCVCILSWCLSILVLLRQSMTGSSAVMPTTLDDCVKC